VSFPRILDRYLLREWAKVFLITALGFPFVAILFELTDKLDTYLAQGLKPAAIALSYVYGLPEKLFLVIPAAVLFATVFSIGSMGRNSEITAAKASGRSFHRLVVPVLCSAVAAAGLALVLGELAPPSTRRQLELLGERERRSMVRRFNFAYRAEDGWVYVIRSLDLSQEQMRDVQLEREGTGANYPTLIVLSQRGVYDDSLARWTVSRGRMRILPGTPSDLSFGFDSLRVKSLVETPDELLAEAKKPEEMRYRELGRYIDALERSGGDGRRLRVQQELKLAIPVTCIIIALFGAPLAITNPRAGGAYGIAVSLGTTVSFLILTQLSQAVGAGGILPPVAAAWTPNALFGVGALWLMKAAPT
jgi:lipopolysaccharide export system permease protein